MSVKNTQNIYKPTRNLFIEKNHKISQSGIKPELPYFLGEQSINSITDT